MFLKFREDFWVATVFKTSTFEVPKIFSEFFSPSFGWVLPGAWPRAAVSKAKHRCTGQPTMAAIPWSSGSWRRRRPWMRRTETAVASEEDIGGETSWGLGIPLWGSVSRCWWFTDGSTYFGGYCFICLESVSKHLHRCLVLLFVNTTVPTLWVGVFLTQGFSSRNRVSCPSQFNLFLRFRSVHSDMVYNEALLDRITGSLFAVLTNRRNLCFFPVNIRARPLTRLHEISTARDWFQILLCPNRTHVCFLRDGTFFKFPQSILTANLVHMAFFNQLDVIKTSSKPQCSLSLGRIFEWPQFSKLRLLRCPKFSQSFSPLRSVGFCLWLGLGLRLPRWNTAALRSRERPRFRGPAAPGGEGSRGCEGRRRPWPRRRILVGKPHEALGVRCEGKWMKVLMVHWWFHFSVDIVFSFVERISQNFVCTKIWCFLLPYVFCTTFVTEIYGVYRQDRHVLLTIRSDHFIPNW